METVSLIMSILVALVATGVAKMMIEGEKEWKEDYLAGEVNFFGV